MVTYDILRDPEANIRYQRCQDVDRSWWEALAAADPQEVSRRVPITKVEDGYRLPYFCWTLEVTPARRQGRLLELPERELEFQTCLIALAYLLQLDVAALEAAPQVSPKAYKGGVTFFQGPHALPTARLEERFGSDREGFLAAGRLLGGREVPQADAALELAVFPGLRVGVLLWLADEEFPAQVSFAVPAALEHFWALDAVWALLNVVTRELCRAGRR